MEEQNLKLQIRILLEQNIAFGPVKQIYLKQLRELVRSHKLQNL